MLKTSVLLALLLCGVGTAGEGTAVKVGDPVPDVSAPDENGKAIKLSDYKGKSGLVIFFYPKADTGG